MKRIDRTPITERRFGQDLVDLGIKPGATLIVHSSLSAIGWVVGGPQTVVHALIDAVGKDGNLAMPAATPQSADPATWTAPEIPPQWLDEVRNHLPAFDPDITPTSLGAIPETFRNWPGTLRSLHPLESVCARGPKASEITRTHSLEFSEGPGTPFGKLHDLDSQILLLGVGFNRCTALHFAESLMSNRRTMTVRFPTDEDGRRVWIEVPNVADDNDTHFPIVGERYLAEGRARQGLVGDASSVLFAMRDLVDFAKHYFSEALPPSD